MLQRETDIANLKLEVNLLFYDDGQVDFISSENCVTDGVIVSVDEDSFENYKEGMEHNFCYTATPAWRKVVSKVTICLAWAGEVALAISSAPAAAITIPLAQAGWRM